MRRLIEAFRAAAVQFSLDGGPFLAQAIAFNAMFAVFPLVTLGVAALGFVYGTDQGIAQANALLSTLAPSVRMVLAGNFQHILAFRGISGVIALAALLWSGKNLFQGLAYALDRALGVPKGRPLIHDIAVSLVMLPILALLMLLGTAAPLVLAFFIKLGGFRNAVILSEAAAYVTSILLVFVVTMVLYTYLPNRKVELRFGVPGAIFTTFAWELAQVAFTIYSTHVDFTKVFGALAELALVLLWFYYMAYIFLFGAQVSAQWYDLRATALHAAPAEGRRSA